MLATILFGFLFIQYTLAVPTQSCKIAFRLDDIQDSWLVQTQQDIINLFMTKQVPITVGIISGFFGPTYDANTQMPAYLNNLLKNGNAAYLEISSHTIDHTQLTTQSLAVQQNVCSQSKADIEALLPDLKEPLVTMICPYDAFNQDTLNALRSTGYTTISAMFDANTALADSHNFYSTCADAGVINTLSHVPSHAQSSQNGNGVLFPKARILQDMEDSCNQCGFSVVEMHFVEYTTPGTTTTDAAAMAELTEILDTIKTWPGSQRKLKDVFDNTYIPPPTAPFVPVSSTPTPPPQAVTPTPPPSPTPVVTPRAPLAPSAPQVPSVPAPSVPSVPSVPAPSDPVPVPTTRAPTNAIIIPPPSPVTSAAAPFQPSVLFLILALISFLLY